MINELQLINEAISGLEILALFSDFSSLSSTVGNPEGSNKL